jgi:hypothetical protein
VGASGAFFESLGIVDIPAFPAYGKVRLFGYGSCGLGDEMTGLLWAFCLGTGRWTWIFEDRRPGTILGRRWVSPLYTRFS